MERAYKSDELFVGAAPYYARFRNGYPNEMFESLEAHLSLDGSQRAMDLGCGTGQVAIPLSRSVAEVIAVDPDREMLKEGKRLAAEAGAKEISWLEGDAERLPERARELDLIAMGQSFHWMDRPRALVSFDRLVAPGGSLALIGFGREGSPKREEWEEAIRTVRERYLGPGRRAGSGTYSHPEKSHEEVLIESPFPKLHRARFPITIERDLDQVVGLQLSLSYSSPGLLGDDLEDFKRDLRGALAEVNPDGDFSLEAEIELVIAKR